MPLKHTPTNLSGITPTTAELAAAKKLLADADDKKRRSTNGCLSNFLKANPDAKIEGTRGPERDYYLQLFLVHQMRQKEARKEVVNNRSVSSEKESHTEYHEWSEEKMNSEMGAAKAEGLRKSGKLNFQPCSITKSTEKHMIEWIVPKNWKSQIERDNMSLQFQSTAEAADSDLALLGETAKEPLPEVKKEPLTETQKLAIRITEFNNTKQQVLRKFQDMEVSAKSVATRVTQKSTQKSENKYTESFKTDLAAHVSKLTKTIKILVRACSEDMNESELPKLLDTLNAITTTDADLNDWANRFGFVTAQPKKRARKSN